MAHSSFGKPWPVCSSPIVTLVRVDGLRLPVHVELVELVSMLCDLTELSGYDIYHPGTWGYACRAIAGTRKPSNHSTGTAVDINAPSNPMRRPLTTDIPPEVRQLWKDHGFRWGGDYSTTPDAMHFEFLPGSVADAQAITARLRSFLAAAGGPPPPPPAPLPPTPPPTGDTMASAPPPTLREGARGQEVRNMQGLLVAHGNTLTVDGIFGAGTKRVLAAWQGRAGLAADGVCGPCTWQHLTGIDLLGC